MGKHQSASVDSVPFIYASIIAPVPDLIDDQGGRIERPFSEASLPIDLVTKPEKIIPIPGYLGLLEAAACETGDRGFGISIGERLRFEDLGPFGQLILAAATLGEAIETSCQMVQHYSNAGKSWLTFEGETAYWHYDMASGRDHGEGRRLDCETTMVLYRTLVRVAAGAGWQPSEIWVEPATSEELRALQLRLGVDARASGEGYAMGFPRHLLDLPMTDGTPLTTIERLRLYDQLLSTKPKESFVGSIEAVVSSWLSVGYPDIKAVARSLGLSVRTLQRRIGDDGAAYSDVVDKARRELALAMLSDSSNSQLDTALALGYREASSFSRSFKRWTSQTPRDYRRRSAGKADLRRTVNRIDASRQIGTKGQEMLTD